MSDCPIGPDGKLLDAKDIQWYKDIDSLELINQAATPSSMTTASSSATIHPIFHGGPPPAVVVAGAHCSGHAVCPSNRITDPDNAKTLSSNTTHKCKASGSTDSNKSDDYEPDIAEHPATTSDGKGGDTEPDEDLILLMHLLRLWEMWITK
ncbi:hypothetical protein L208DRAFT_1261062 [Tricholoma matsutake]|nr:hypothetical protein L208DRAFT_1261062 [Tricholoma matsutake 945]